MFPAHRHCSGTEWSGCGHFVELYASDETLLRNLAAFVQDGLVRGEAVVVIATPDHCRGLEQRLAEMDEAPPRVGDNLHLLDANECLASFMVNGWPDKTLFFGTMTDLVRRASAGGRKIRLFGEMVALLWERRACESTVRLEYLWDELCARENLPLFCAYPRRSLAAGPRALVDGIHRAHGKVFCT